jgi:hypothetical protein
MITDTMKIKKWTFRYLVFALFGSFFYDIIWLLMLGTSYSADDDTGVEKSIRKFSVIFSTISFFFRVSIIYIV